MVDNGFIFGDQATWDFPILKVEKYPEIPTPVKRYQTYTVPGRSGDLHVFEGAFDNITKSYACYFHADDFVSETAYEIKQWMLANQGYQRLIDMYDQEHYYRASILSEIKIENWMNKYARFTVNFSCDPRAFLISGDIPLSIISNGTMLRNPCAFPAQPLVTVYGAGDGSLTVGGVTVELFGLDGEISLDCEDMEAYRLVAGVMVSRNKNISAPEFPVLQPGPNEVTWIGGVERVEIIPRWWTL